MGGIEVFLTGLDEDLVPEPGPAKRDWWGQDPLTSGHAHHCLPLTMANTLGYTVRSPGSFRITWDGSSRSHARVSEREGCTVDAHSAAGTFTVQPGFIPRTKEPGDFLMIRPVPNLRGAWFTAMEALIEAWWQPGEFGLVLMVNRAGSFDVGRGQPLAQMCVYRQEGGSAGLEVRRSMPAETRQWRERRHRTEYRKDLDYLCGRHPDGTPEPTHRRNWRKPQDAPPV